MSDNIDPYWNMEIRLRNSKLNTDLSEMCRYRDLIWLFASPVVYPASMVPEQFRFLYALNPMTGVIEGFRWALLGTNPPTTMIFISLVVVIALLVSRVFYFRRMEQYFADVV